jgi:hypothetical protein
VLGEANCVRRFGDIARDRPDPGAARTFYRQALNLYLRIPEPYSIGHTHRRLARLASGPERRAHVAAAREAWVNIGRQDLVDDLDREFGGSDDLAEGDNSDD